MDNYLCINNEKIELPDELIAELRERLGTTQIKLRDVAIGDTFKIGNHEFIVLEHSGDTTAVILKDLLSERWEFGANNNFDGSFVDEACKSFAAEISELVGAGNLVEHTVDLTSDDGLKDYGQVRRQMSLLTAPKYRRYVDILDKHKVDKWWWLATPFSTERHGNSYYVLCVSPSGIIGGSGYDGRYGVRPFCILKSNIFVSK